VPLEDVRVDPDVGQFPLDCAQVREDTVSRTLDDLLIELATQLQPVFLSWLRRERALPLQDRRVPDNALDRPADQVAVTERVL
jgi:hypothetical protein